ncbi:uncharacterized protein B0P05DRAFT_584626 [Gilbertella persicaria]|uniref:uncharacterized protein n=1 Tax=Gilbertella persicaria TaxID=101096 RepID=UPI00221FAE53|nr:uncharacterized protein B0P05DRAFT_584626 [Gilbertella persicaria]KAI8087923.1 hypothetical protein B0P05DRAFT_584626 [Gilbertella persicaria]
MAVPNSDILAALQQQMAAQQAMIEQIMQNQELQNQQQPTFQHPLFNTQQQVHSFETQPHHDWSPSRELSQLLVQECLTTNISN